MIRWLDDRNQGDLLGFLADVPVNRSNRFPEWASRHPELKFEKWQEIGFLPAGYKETTTEALPILRSAKFEQFGGISWIEGGVSLARRGLITERAPLDRSLLRKIEPTTLRSNLDYAATAEGGTVLRTFDKTVFDFPASHAGQFRLVAIPDPKIKLRGGISELANDRVEYSFVTEGPAQIQAVAFDGRTTSSFTPAPIGELSVSHRQNGLAIAWQGRALDKAHALANALSAVGQPAAVLAVEPSVEAAVVIPAEGSIFVKSRGADSWARFGIAPKETSTLGKEWLSRTSDPSGRRTIRTALVDEDVVRDALARAGRLKATAADEGRNIVWWAVPEPPPAARLVQLDGGDGVVRAPGTMTTGRWRSSGRTCRHPGRRISAISVDAFLGAT